MTDARLRTIHALGFERARAHRPRYVLDERLAAAASCSRVRCRPRRLSRCSDRPAHQLGAGDGNDLRCLATPISASPWRRRRQPVPPTRRS
jgi:hypothetical protein